MLMHIRILHPNRSRASALSFPSRLIRDRGSRSSLRGSFRFDQRRQRLVKRFPRLRKNNPILRPLRPRQTRLNHREIQRKQLRIFRLRRLLVMKHSLLAAISLHQRNQFLTPSRQPQIPQSLPVNRKNSASRPIFWAHVGDCGAVG